MTGNRKSLAQQLFEAQQRKAKEKAAKERKTGGKENSHCSHSTM